ncbi:collagenase-like [Copidosoma floridanum]|uniref:collagenase-like n=1 Tax=Copidosoma floridanum TaxID=29053 RepID=UPI000C6F7DB7|nr:collagenase-like [Copidosoma floridanum]
MSALVEQFVGLESENIINGALARRKQFPYIVWIGIGYNKEKVRVCGGTLIAPDIVLTAAHCVYDIENLKFKDDPFAVVAESIDIYERGYSIPVSKIYSHKSIKSLKSLRFDIAVLKLKNSFSVGGKAYNRLALLPKKNETYSDEFLTIMGFGHDGVNETVDTKTNMIHYVFTNSGKLKFATVKLKNLDDCEGLPDRLCGNVEQGLDSKNRTACFGDSGSPLMYKNTVIGVISYVTTELCNTNQEIGFARVSYFLDFIKGAVNDQPTNDTLVQLTDDYELIEIQGQKSGITTKSRKLIDALKKYNELFSKHVSTDKECTRLSNIDNRDDNEENNFKLKCEEAENIFKEYEAMRTTKNELLKSEPYCLKS